MNEDIKEMLFIAKMIVYIIIVCMITIMLCGCGPTKYITVEKEVPVEKVRIEYKTNTKIDSIYIKDSVNIYSKGDTIFKDKIQLIYKDRFRTDTIHKTDSIDRPIYINTTEIKEVKKPLNWLQKFLIWSGGAVWILSIIFLTRKIEQHKHLI